MSSSDDGANPKSWPWIIVVVIASLALSRAFACATPVVAIATLAAFSLRGRDAVLLVFAVWLGNQVIGFGLLNYPLTGSTFGWGVAILGATLAGLATAREVAWRTRLHPFLSVAIGLVAAYTAYEVVLLTATAILPSGSGVFAAAVVLRIFAINAAALALLIVARRLAGVVGVLAANPMTARAFRGHLQSGPPVLRH